MCLFGLFTLLVSAISPVDDPVQPDFSRHSSNWHRNVTTFKLVGSSHLMRRHCAAAPIAFGAPWWAYSLCGGSSSTRSPCPLKLARLRACTYGPGASRSLFPYHVAPDWCSPCQITNNARNTFELVRLRSTAHLA